MKKNILKPIFHAILMIIFFMLSYLFIYTGISTETKIYVNYKTESNTSYEVKLLSNDIYDNIEYYDWNYITSLVDDIKINFNYKDTLSEYASGYYKYNVKLNLIMYQDNENNIISQKEYLIKDDTVTVIDDNYCNLIKLDKNFIIDFNTYKSIFDKLKSDHDIDALGKLEVRINIYEYLGFDKIEGDIPIENEILLTIPLNEKTVKINVNNIDALGSISSFSKKEDINYINIILGILFLSLAITFMIDVIKIIKKIYEKESKYKKELKEILTKYDDIIVEVKKIVNVKDYNLIYVSNFKDLLDVYETNKSVINYKETKKNIESIFVIISEDNAWIYKLNNEKMP